ncbi:alkane oxidation protein activator PraB [Pseudomonas solani]|uniref:alkane oxidation protein activator PraB n=1 Tax=Pseudomonas solani TaxID=2731552 RepID=UPI0035BE4ED2
MNMKIRALIFFVLSAISFNALALTITPTNLAFSAKGVLVIKSGLLPGVTCNVEFIGVTNSNNTATINSVSVTGGGLCTTVSASGLPWTWTATSLTNATISGVKFSVAGTTCSSSPVTLAAAWLNAANTLIINPNQSVGSCVIQTLSLTPNPPLVVVPVP